LSAEVGRRIKGKPVLFVIHCLDGANKASKRTDNYPAHRAFLETAEKFGVRIVMSGPLMTDDGTSPIGSHFVIDAPDRKAVEAFHQADPFYATRVWDKVSIAVFDKKRG
jgi:uncharacterized protein YciI